MFLTSALDRLRAKPDRGASTLQYVGSVATAAVLVVGLIAVANKQETASIAAQAICAVKTQQTCTAPANAPGGDPSADTGDREDQQRGARDDRRGRGEDDAPDSEGTEGTTSPDDPLGAPVNGTSVDEPDPPAWSPPDEGAGEHGSESAWPWDYGKEFLVEVAANALSGNWPDAARNLLHFLGNSGDPLDQDVDQILDDVPGFQTQVDQVKDDLGQDAVARAQAAGATGPVTFPVNTPWNGYYIGKAESENWFYALGGVSFNQTGQVTVYPPSSPGGPWRYEVSTRVNLRDQYNWDGSKSTTIGPLDVTDEELAKLHRQGLAQEYLNQGQSELSTTKGTVE